MTTSWLTRIYIFLFCWDFIDSSRTKDLRYWFFDFRNFSGKNPKPSLLISAAIIFYLSVILISRVVKPMIVKFDQFESAVNWALLVKRNWDVRFVGLNRFLASKLFQLSRTNLKLVLGCKELNEVLLKLCRVLEPKHQNRSWLGIVSNSICRKYCHLTPPLVQKTRGWSHLSPRRFEK